MFRPDLWHRDDPELVAARARTSELLRAAIPGDDRDAETAFGEVARLLEMSP